MRTPRGEAPQRFAIASDVLTPSSMAVKISRSMAAFNAADCW